MQKLHTKIEFSELENSNKIITDFLTNGNMYIFGTDYSDYNDKLQTCELPQGNLHALFNIKSNQNIHNIKTNRPINAPQDESQRIETPESPSIFNPNAKFWYITLQMKKYNLANMNLKETLALRYFYRQKFTNYFEFSKKNTTFFLKKT